MFQTLESDEAAVQTSTVLTDFFSAVDQQPSPLPPSPPSSLRTLEYILRAFHNYEKEGKLTLDGASPLVKEISR
jgi:hypothetical protein